MRIAFIDEDLSLRTGSRRFTYEVTRQLQMLGHKVNVFTTKMDRQTCFKKYLSLPVEVVSGRASPSLKVLKETLKHKRDFPLVEVANNFNHCLAQSRRAMDISRKVAEIGSDVAMVHYHGEHWLSPFFYFLNETKGVAYLNVVPPAPRPHALPFQELTVRRRMVDSLLNLPPMGNWKRRSFSKLALFVAPSRYLIDQAQRRHKLGNREAVVVPLGVDHSEFCPTGEEEPFALYAGRIHPHKSLELAVLAMENTESAYSLVIAGDIDEQHLWYKEKLVRLAEKVGISDRFQMVLFPSDSEIVRLMQRCAAFLFPSTIDTFGLVVLEAMACGKPMIACDRGGVPEIVGNAGFLLEPNIGQWQKTVNRVLSDPVLRQEAGIRALERSRAFSWEKTTERLLQTFERTIGLHSVVRETPYPA